MAETDSAIALALKAATVGGLAVRQAIVRTASNKAVSTAVKKAGEQAAKNAANGATKSSGRYLVRLRTDRKHRRLAMDLARQIGGKVSLGTVIAGERYYVVWRGDVPVDCFPVLPKAAGPLAERPELSGFVGQRVTPPPK
jgi:hypothetical protein